MQDHCGTHVEKQHLFLHSFLLNNNNSQCVTRRNPLKAFILHVDGVAVCEPPVGLDLICFHGRIPAT